MFAFFNLGLPELTVLLAFGMIVVVPLIVGIVALTKCYDADRASRDAHR